MKVTVPVGKIIALLGKVIRYAPGGITPEERDVLVADLLAVLVDLAPDTVELPIRHRGSVGN